MVQKGAPMSEPKRY